MGLVNLISKIKILIMKFKYNNKQCNIGKINMPISSNIEISKDAKIDIKSISMYSNVSIRIRDNSTFLVGDNVSLNNNCIIGCKKKIEIGNNTAIGPNVLIFDHNHDYLSNDFRNNYICDDIIIGNNVWIGGGTIILAGSKIGDNSVIGAGSIVNCTIPSNTVYYNKKTGISKQITNN